MLIFVFSQLSAQTDQRFTFEPLSESCCYTFSYELFANDPAYNAFELRLPADLDLSALQIDLGSGWFVEELFLTNGYRFYLSDFSPIPLQAIDLIRICLDNDYDELNANIEVRWYINSALLALSNASLTCASCDIPFQDSIVCTDSSGYELWLKCYNYSNFQIDELYIEGLGSNMTSVEARRIEISGGLASGDTSDWLLVTLNAAAELMPDICLDISSQRYLDTLRLECCRSSYCTELPVCDRCCDDETDFINDVMAGFQITVNNPGDSCNTVDIQVAPRQLTDCDTTRISRRFLATNTSIVLPGRGNQVAQFNGVPQTGEYEICMSVTRVNFEQDACFSDGTLAVCDTIFLDCLVSVGDRVVESAINLVFPNPAREAIWLAPTVTTKFSLATLLAINGKQLAQRQQPTANQVLFYLNELPTGLYFILLIDEKGRQYRQRIVKL